MVDHRKLYPELGSLINQLTATLNGWLFRWKQTVVFNVDPKIEKRLAMLTALKKGWDSYGGDPPNTLAIENARQFVEFLYRNDLYELLSITVNPSCMRGVGVSFDIDNCSVFVEFYNKGNAHCLLHDDSLAERMVTHPVEISKAGFSKLMDQIYAYNSNHVLGTP